MFVLFKDFFIKWCSAGVWFKTIWNDNSMASEFVLLLDCVNYVTN